MPNFELIMPQMGESVAEASITSFLKEVGDTIEIDEAIVEIATDKVDSEIPSPVAGTLIKKLFDVNDTIKVGQAIAIIETEGEKTETTQNDNNTTEIAKNVEENIYSVKESINTCSQQENTKEKSDKFFSPLVKSIAKKEGLSLNELNKIKGSGSQNRVTKNDILEYLKNKDFNNIATVTTETTKPISTPSPQIISGQDQIIEMDRMRKIISDHMTMSLQTSAHVTSFVEADVTNIVNWRNKIKHSFQKREGQKITFTPIFVEAVAKAIKDFPMINSSVNGTQIIRKGNINIGMATALPNGNLIVPVIKNADNLNLLGLTKIVNDLANRARNNNLKPDEIQGGTFTLTNVGGFGNIMGTPIINQPQVAILAVGTITKKPAVIETPQGDTIGIRHKMFLSHSYDHRIIDGGLGGMFVKRVSEYLESFDPNTDI